MNNQVILEDTAYVLKRKGEFDKALQAYAKEYRRNTQGEDIEPDNIRREGSRYLARLCFEEMVDIILITYLRDQRRFDTSVSLLNTLRDDLERLFAEMQIRDAEGFEEFFNRSRRKLFPRGRGKSAFSVDRNQLLTPRVAEFEDMPAMVKEDKADYKAY